MTDILTYDPGADALGIQLWSPRAGVAIETREVAPGVFLDFTPDGRLVALELLNASQHLPKARLRALPDATVWLRLADAAKLAGIQRDTLRQLIHAKRLPGQKQGRDWVVAEHELLAYLASRAPQGRPGAKARAAVAGSGVGPAKARGAVGGR